MPDLPRGERRSQCAQVVPPANLAALAVRVLIWGTADFTKPRARILVAALKAAGVEIVLIHEAVWDDVKDKSGLKGFSKLSAARRYVSALLRLRRRLGDAPAHDVVIIGYLGLFDVLAYRWLARGRPKPLVWDAFLSLYDTVVGDRQLIGANAPMARALWRLEGAAARIADRVVLDTGPHATRFGELFGLPETKLAAVPVGAEAIFSPLPPKRREGPLTILFYGQFIPLHGVDIIVSAARLARNRGWHWRIIGDGQEAPRVRASLTAAPVPGLDWIDWVPYDALSAEIAAADVCLGIFGQSAKAASVVPNKAYQVLASGRPLITRGSPAMSELIPTPVAGIELVPAGNPEALFAALVRLEATLPREGFSPGPEYQAVRNRFAMPTLANRWLAVVTQLHGG
jgi:glycosyltransferase involved in cell wall biosynthesis